MQRSIALSLAVVVSVLASGCSMMAPQYSASLPNVQKLKDAGSISTKVGTFNAEKTATLDPNAVKIRASELLSPYGTYNAYLAAAIKQELELAGKLAPNSDTEISGVLLKNSIDASGFSVGIGNIEARFIVKKGGQVKYDKIKSVNTQWESSFAGAIAIPKAQLEYTSLVQQLLAGLYADAEFLQALK